MKQSIISTANSTSNLPITSTQSADATSQYSQDVQSNEKTNIFKCDASAVRRTKAIANRIKNALNAITKRFLSLTNRTMDQTPLIDAIRRQKLEAVDALIQNPTTNLNERDKYGTTPLMWAATTRNYAVIDALKDKGVDVNARDNLGRTALIWTVSSPGLNDSKSVKHLLNIKDIDVSLKDNFGDTALDHAEKWDKQGCEKQECIKLLRDFQTPQRLNCFEKLKLYFRSCRK